MLFRSTEERASLVDRDDVGLLQGKLRSRDLLRGLEAELSDKGWECQSRSDDCDEVLAGEMILMETFWVLLELLADLCIFRRRIKILRSASGVAEANTYKPNHNRSCMMPMMRLTLLCRHASCTPLLVSVDPP